MTPEKLTQNILIDKDFLSLKSFIITTTGLSYFAQRDEDLAGRIARRFQQIGAKDCAQYKIMLGSSTGPGSEFDSLVTELTIGETFFFRHVEQFDALRQIVLPKLIEKRLSEGKRSLRIWCAGCSTGAEPYTLSIILRHEYRVQLAGWTIEILGTDINRSFLSRATLGHFDDWHLRTLPEAMKALCFKRNGGEKGWLLNEEFKKGVRFAHHNLISGHYPPVSEANEPFDIIFCRNVMIYFNAETVASILPRFDRCLVEEGFLFLGYSEINTDLYKAFEPISFPGALLFRKRNARDVRDASINLAALNFAPLPPLALSPKPALPAPEFRPALAAPLASTAIEGANLGEVRNLANSGDYRSALKRVDEILLLNALDAKAHFLRGVILSEQGNTEAAEEALKKAVYIDRKFALAHYHLGLVYRKLGDDQKSSRYLLNVVDLIRDLPDKTVLMEGDTMTVFELNLLIKTMKEAS